MPTPNRPWSATDLRKLRAFAAKGLPSSVAAKRLRRTYGATRFKAHDEGIRFRSLGRAHSEAQRARYAA